MTIWIDRPQEEAHLLNPAFCSIGITGAVVGYQQVASRGLPLPLAYLVLPITLHKPTRDLLPRDRRTSLPLWIQDNAAVRLLFHQRLMSLKQFTNEAILFGCQKGWIAIDDSALIVSDRQEAALRRAYQALGDEPKECSLKAVFIGKWFAGAGPTATVMALWGVQP